MKNCGLKVGVSSQFSVTKFLFCHLIIVFSEKTPIEIIKKIKPNLLVKGSDYKENQIIGAKEVKKYGGKILRAKILSNFSSSIIIDEILNTSF